MAELLVVILLLALLSGLIFSVSTGVFSKGDRSRAQSELEGISVALESFRQRFGDYPDVATPRQLFDALDGRLGPRGNPLEPRFPPFLDSGNYTLSDLDLPELLDPWGEAYQYQYVEPDNQTKRSRYFLFSKGPDGKATQFGDGSDTSDDDNIRYGD